ncbi:MAG: autotransporter outer membrane beta-barrel domain-containing protein [Ideonella sp.]|nr:autotransporter outer membrane beta-barrel domain-containing protein [Ideonella sp.]MCC7458444.1 autotransporter outer membrane beta-barrel domain-containing protein [Nitrospira sp.]
MESSSRSTTCHWIAAWVVAVTAATAVTATDAATATANAIAAAEPLSQPLDNRLVITRGVVYAGAAFLSARGGRAPYRFSVDAPSLPAGLRLLPDGSVAGITCAADGAYLLRAATAIDAAGARSGAALPLLTVEAPTLGGCTLSLQASWPKPVVGQPYRTLLSARGGAGPYRFVVAAGTLPAGLTLSPAGVLEGTPQSMLPQAFTLAVHDARGATGVLVATLAPLVVRVGPSALPAAAAGSAYRQALTVEGAMRPYRFAVTGGTLPAGLRLHPDGRLSGTPMAAGRARFNVEVTDAGGVTVTRRFALRVAPPRQAVAGAPVNGSAVAVPFAGSGAMNAVHERLASAVAAAAATPLAVLPSSLTGATPGDRATRASAAAVASTAKGIGAAGPAGAADTTPDAAAVEGIAHDAAPVLLPDPAGDATLAGLQAAEAEALGRLGGAQLRNVQARLEGDTDCRPEWEQTLQLNAPWRDVRPARSEAGPDAGSAATADRAGCTRGAALWAAGAIDYGRTPDTGVTEGSRFSTPGLTAGLDLAPWRGVRSGIAFGRGQDRSAVGGGSGRVDTRSDSVTVYGSWRTPLGVRLNAMLGQAHTTFDLQRTIVAGESPLLALRRATQRYGAIGASTRLELGAWQCAPRIGVEQMRAALDGYTEGDAVAAALGFGAARVTRHDLHGGVALSRQWKRARWTVEPQLSVDWHRRPSGGLAQQVRYLDDPLGTRYAMASIEPSSEFAQVGLGVRLSHPRGWVLSLNALGTIDAGAPASSAYTAALQWPL